MIYILCLKIFLVRILDVSLGTFRTILTVKGKTLYASLVGFFEILVWFLIVKEALNTTESGLIIGISYSLGFAVGTYVGGILSNKFIVMPVSVQIVTSKFEDLLVSLKEKFGYSVIDIKGLDDSVAKKMILVETTNKHTSELTNIVNNITHINNKTNKAMNRYPVSRFPKPILYNIPLLMKLLPLFLIYFCLSNHIQNSVQVLMIIKLNLYSTCSIAL